MRGGGGGGMEEGVSEVGRKEGEWGDGEREVGKNVYMC